MDRERPGPPLAEMGLFGILRDKKVQEELDLTEEQIEKLKTLGQKLRGEMRQRSTNMRQQWDKIRDLTPEQRRAKLKELREKADEDMEKARDRWAERMATVKKELAEILQSAQLERLEQIHLQWRGIRAIEDPDVAKALGITDEQKEKLEALRKEIAEKRQELFRSLQDLSREERRETMRAKTTELMKDAEQKLLDVLSTEQRDKLEKMKGEKFELDFRPPRPDGPANARPPRPEDPSAELPVRRRPGR